MKILRLMQEIHGMAEVTNRRPPARTTAALALQIHPPAFRKSIARQKRTLRISIQDPPDIPQEVEIIHLTGHQQIGMFPAR
jgi:hypothetical protein